MTNTFKIILTSFILTACSRDHNPDTFESTRSLVDTSRIAVLSLDTSSEYIRGQVNGKQTTLSFNEIVAIEPLFVTAVSKYNKSGSIIKFKEWKLFYDSLNAKLETFCIDIHNYNRQYVATTTLLGQKEVYINCFHQDEDPEFRNNHWKTEMALAEGGGMNYFHLTVNLTTKKFTDITVNAFE